MANVVKKHSISSELAHKIGAEWGDVDCARAALALVPDAVPVD